MARAQTTVSPLSAATDWRGIKIAATAAGSTGGDLLHTFVAGSDTVDIVELWAYNSDTSSIVLTVMAGGVTSPDDETKKTIPDQDGKHFVGEFSGNNANELRAYAATTNKIVITGIVKRTTDVAT